jgi:hypothetical protein
MWRSTSFLSCQQRNYENIKKKKTVLLPLNNISQETQLPQKSEMLGEFGEKGNFREEKLVSRNGSHFLNQTAQLIDSIFLIISI